MARLGSALGLGLGTWAELALAPAGVSPLLGPCCSAQAVPGGVWLRTLRLTGPLLPTAVALAVLLAVLVAVLLGSVVTFFVWLCRRSQELSLSVPWSPLDDKEYLMSNAYTL